MDKLETFFLVAIVFFAGMLAGFLLCLFKLPEFVTMMQGLIR